MIYGSAIVYFGKFCSSIANFKKYLVLMNIFSVIMKIKAYNCYNEDAGGKINPINTIKRVFETTDIVLNKIKELNPDLFDIYIIKLTEKLNSTLKDFKQDLHQYNLTSITNELELLQKQSDLQKTILRFIVHSLALPTEYNPEEGEVHIIYSNAINVTNVFSYHRVKTLVELLGKNHGSKLYKKIVPDLVKHAKQNSNINETTDPGKLTLDDHRKSSIETWCRIGLADFTVVVFDDYKVLYRFDKCGVHEALKKFADPDIAYLASCYLGDVKEYNEGKVIHMRRTQTLHHGSFCDELYWNNVVYEDTQQPPLAFTESLQEN